MTSPDFTVQRPANLGHPARINQAREQFADALAQATVLASHDPTAINGQLGRALLDLRNRMSHLLMAMDIANTALPEDTDSDDSRSILTMAEEYAVETADRFDKFAGLVLVVMEQNGAAELTQ